MVLQTRGKSAPLSRQCKTPCGRPSAGAFLLPACHRGLVPSPDAAGRLGFSLYAAPRPNNCKHVVRRVV